MSLYTFVNEKVGSLFSQGIGHVTTMVGLVRNYSTIPLSESFGASGNSWFSSVQTDTYANADPSANLDMSGVIDLSGNLNFLANSPRRRTPLWPSILFILGWIFTLFIASLVANEMIMLPYQMRLFGFLAVLVACYVNPLIYFGILMYYMFKVLYNTFTGKERKFPYIFAFLPLRTAKEGETSGLFTYFKDGSVDKMHEVLKEIIEPETIKSLEKAFPNYEKWKSTLSPQVDAFNKYVKVINQTMITTAPRPSADDAAAAASAAAAAAAAAPPVPSVPSVPSVSSAPVASASSRGQKDPSASPPASASSRGVSSADSQQYPSRNIPTRKGAYPNTLLRPSQLK